MFTLFKGFVTGCSLIIAIGAQNAFVLRQGLLKKHLLVTALLSSCLDVLLILLGVFGFGELLTLNPYYFKIVLYAASAFLIFYGAMAFKRAWKEKCLASAPHETITLKRTVFLLFAFSLLNPHVYLDTVILLGSIAAGEEKKLFFAIGASLASFLWFFTLTFGSSYLSPFLNKPTTWRVIDIGVAVVMWTIALALLTS